MQGENPGKGKQRVCFVVMGFGKKIAYDKEHKPRALDLDRTFEAIIKPAVEANNLRCVRADKMLHAGMIDTPMYGMLLHADLVIADISTGNVNAVYELGVRHVLRPHTTIIMLEDKASFSFDLNHVATFGYTHMGDDIGSKEAGEKQARLTALIAEIMSEPKRDSPVYEFLRGLQQPTMSEEDYAAILQLIEDAGDRLQSHLAEARAAEAKEDFVAAAEAFRKALEIIESPRPKTTGGEGEQDAIGQTEREYVRQRWAFNTYKSKRPDARTALEKGLEIMKALNPDTSNDTETLGITGAIHKRLWQMKGDVLDAVRARAHLDKAVEHYGRGFNVKKDYYNGENYAVVLEMRAGQQQDPDEASYDLMTANKVRKEIVKLLQPVLAAPEFDDRPDKAWVYATLANCQFALGNELEAQRAETQFKSLAKLGWMLDTYEAGKAAVLAARMGS